MQELTADEQAFDDAGFGFYGFLVLVGPSSPEKLCPSSLVTSIKGASFLMLSLRGSERSLVSDEVVHPVCHHGHNVEGSAKVGAISASVRSARYDDWYGYGCGISVRFLLKRMRFLSGASNSLSRPSIAPHPLDCGIVCLFQHCPGFASLPDAFARCGS